MENGVLVGFVFIFDKVVRNVYKNLNLFLYEIVKMVLFNGVRYCKVDDYKG